MTVLAQRPSWVASELVSVASLRACPASERSKVRQRRAPSLRTGSSVGSRAIVRTMRPGWWAILVNCLSSAGAPRAAVRTCVTVVAKYFLRRSRARCEGQGTVRGSRLGAWQRLDPRVHLRWGGLRAALRVYPDTVAPPARPANPERASMLQRCGVVASSDFWRVRRRYTVHLTHRTVPDPVTSSSVRAMRNCSARFSSHRQTG